MDGTRSREALADFLSYLAAKGLMAGATVAARKAAASKILSVLSEDEGRDVTSIDIDDVVSRFQRLHGRNYTPDSLATYKSRLRSAVSDFSAYLDNPLGYRPSTQGREKVARGQKDSVTASRVKIVEQNIEAPRPVHVAAPSTTILPIPLRADLTVFIQGIPFDLTETEARKIAAVVSAMAIS